MNSPGTNGEKSISDILKFQSPTTLFLAGASQSGKTTFTAKLLYNADAMFTEPPKQIFYAYDIYQPLFDEMKERIPNILFHQGLPTEEDIEMWTNSRESSVLVLDDLLSSVVSSESALRLFTINSHHKNCTVIFISQLLFPCGKYSRGISLNSHYIILFRSYRDVNQISRFGSQVLPGQLRYFKESYEKSISKAGGYLVVDVCPKSKERRFMLRTNIFPGEKVSIFLPRQA
ncbi:hypothetical protein FSP39_001849 [Pinctada imbricata]|uniref:Uncharacterized protein n=1 Tax=Pinctada imbricata TaxID=66713 RepID=A0AA88YM01_PINIB|nr:hypothetical protein FSP39_001849 [Pinctada imbricata]